MIFGIGVTKILLLFEQVITATFANGGSRRSPSLRTVVPIDRESRGSEGFGHRFRVSGLGLRLGCRVQVFLGGYLGFRIQGWEEV